MSTFLLNKIARAPPFATPLAQAMATTTTTTPDALPLMSMAETSEYVEKHCSRSAPEGMNAAVARPEDPLAAIAAALTARRRRPQRNGGDRGDRAREARRHDAREHGARLLTRKTTRRRRCSKRRGREAGRRGGTALAAKVKAAGGGVKVEPDGSDVGGGEKGDLVSCASTSRRA